MLKNRLMLAKSAKDSKNSLANILSSKKENFLPIEQQLLLNQLPHAVFILDLNNNFIYANQKLINFIGIHKNRYSLQDIINNIHPEDIQKLNGYWKINNDKNTECLKKEIRLKNYKTGEYEWFLFLNHNQSQRSLTTLTNIQQEIINAELTQRKLYEQTEMLEASIDFIYLVHPNGYIHHMNKSSQLAQSERNVEDIKKLQWIDLLPSEMRKKGISAFKKVINGQTAQFMGISNENETIQYWDNILTPISQNNGEISSILCVTRNITAQKNAENILKIASEHDELTGLLNRVGLKKAIQPILKRALSNFHKVGLILIDLDHFKLVNEKYGRLAGDHFLKTLSIKFNKLLKSKVIISRLERDLFAIVYKDLTNKDHLLEICNKIIQLNDEPIYYKTNLLTGAMSIGCAIYPDDANNFLNLLQCADTAIIDLKTHGRGGVRLFDQDMLFHAQKKANQLETARFILRNNLIQPFYQPKIKLKTNELSGLEALLRWYDQKGNFHTPITVQEAFKDFELSSQISEMMHLKIFNDIKTWKNNGKKIIPVAINVAPVEFLRNNYAEIFLQRLHTAQIPPHYIEIEITEHLFADDSIEYVLRALKKLHQAGIKIALDDFGTGHSSLTHLKDFPVDTIKIDYSFVKCMTYDNPIRAIVNGLIKLGTQLPVNIIAEGIETTEQLKLLKKMGCNEGQGYFFHEALSQHEINMLLQPCDLI